MNQEVRSKLEELGYRFIREPDESYLVYFDVVKTEELERHLFYGKYYGFWIEENVPRLVREAKMMKEEY